MTQGKTETTGPRCEACGEPATRTDAEGVPLCEGDYQHLGSTGGWRGLGHAHSETNSRDLPAESTGRPDLLDGE